MALNEGQQTLVGQLAGLEYTPREQGIARNRGTTVSDLRNVVLSKVNDLRTSVRDLEQVTEDGETRTFLNHLINSL